MKLSKKELKTPDKLWIDMKKILEWMTEELTVLIVALGLLFVGSVIGVYIYQKKISTEGKAQFHYAQAKSFAEQIKVADEAPKEGAPKDIKTDRLKAEADLKAALSTLETEFKNSKANAMAELLRGQFAAKAGQWAEAAKHYESYAKALSGSDRSLALYPLAQAQEQSGQLELALKAYSEIVDLKGSAHSEWALIGKARVLRSLNRNDEARKTYESFLSTYPSSPEAGTVRGMIATLSTN